VAAAYGIAVPDFVVNLVVDAINWLLDTDDDRIGTEAVVIEGGAFQYEPVFVPEGVEHETPPKMPVQFTGL